MCAFPFTTPSRTRSANPLPLRRAPVCAVLLRCVGGLGGGLGGQAVQYAAGVVGGNGLLHKGLELFLGQPDGVGQQLLDKPHALAEAVRPILALLLFLLLDKPLFLVGKEKIKNLKFLLDNSFRNSSLTILYGGGRINAVILAEAG